MKTTIALFALILSSSQAMALNLSHLKVDTTGLLHSLQDTQKVLCKDVAAPMAQFNMKIGINIFIIATQAEEAEKAGKLDVVAQASEMVAALQKQSDELNTVFNAKCVKLEELFTEIADKPVTTPPAATDTTGAKPLTPTGN